MLILVILLRLCLLLEFKHLVGTLPKQENFKIISIFDSGLSDFNENIAYINLETLESFFNKNKEDRFIEFYFKNPKNIEIHKKNLTSHISRCFNLYLVRYE